MEPIITYRHSVRGALDEFIEKTKFKGVLRSDALIEIAASVAQHQEEGIALFPQVYVCSDANAFSKHAPDGEIHFVGQSQNVRDGVALAMKKCAPLTSRDWDIIVQVNSANHCRFGIFKPSCVPTSLSLETTYFDAQAETLPAAILVTSPRPSVVTFRSDCGKAVTVCFGHDEIVAEALMPPAELLAKVILNKVNDHTLRDASNTFLTKILRHALRACHGTLICVVDSRWAKSGTLPKLLEDSVQLDPPVDFPAAIAELRNSSGNLEAACGPLSYYELLRGMLSFDGITIFSNDGRVIAYNGFVHAPSPKGKRRDEMQGARKRAFSVLENHLGKPILAAYYQSQDGGTLFKKL
jgi:hypothetical protein